jgi:hypothetical protein
LNRFHYTTGISKKKLTKFRGIALKKRNPLSFTLLIFSTSLIIFFSNKTNATDLAVTGFSSPTTVEFVGRQITFNFGVTNLNVLTAFALEWVVEVEVRNNQNQVVFSETVQGVNIAPYTSVELFTSGSWTPTGTGTYMVKGDVNYIYEINPANDVATGEFMVYDKPDPVTNPTPANGATGVPIENQYLAWSNPSGSPITLTEVYFGTDPNAINANMGLILTNTGPLPSADLPTPLQPGTDYFWKVNVSNPAGVTEGPVNSFGTVEIQVQCVNDPPVINEPFDGQRGLSPDGVPVEWTNPPSDPSIVGTDVWISPTSSGVDPSLTAPISATLSPGNSSLFIPGSELAPETEYGLGCRHKM